MSLIPLGLLVVGCVLFIWAYLLDRHHSRQAPRPPKEEPMKPLLGRLPPEPSRPRLEVKALVPVALPIPPAEVHNLELIADPDMLGNDKWGDCVFAAIENNRRACRAVLGLPLNKVPAQTVVNTYCAYTGVLTPPGPGANEQRALEWVRKNGWPGVTDKLLAFAYVDHAVLPVDQTVAEFHSGVFGSEIDRAQEYPAVVWDAVPSPMVGGHAECAGTYIPTWTGCKTWGYIAQMTPAYLSQKVDEFWVLIWDFMWTSLTYERQVSLISDYQALTGKTWDGPAPVKPQEIDMTNTYTTSILVRMTNTTQKIVNVPFPPGKFAAAPVVMFGPVQPVKGDWQKLYPKMSSGGVSTTGVDLVLGNADGSAVKDATVRVAVLAFGIA